jgi:hypothetical protein
MSIAVVPTVDEKTVGLIYGCGVLKGRHDLAVAHAAETQKRQRGTLADVVFQHSKPLDRRSRERLALHWSLYLTAANALRTHTRANRFAILLDADALQVWVKRTSTRAGDLLTDATEVFRLTAISLLIAHGGLLPAHFTLHAHDGISNEPDGPA